MTKSMLIDTSKCTACRACQIACKQWNQLPAEKTRFTGSYENPTSISPVTWTRIVFQEQENSNNSAGLNWYFSKQGCMHCTDAGCVTVCPTGAIYRTESGTVNVDFDKCIGCNYCAANCPFNVISFDRRTNVPPKCTFCHDRIVNGYQPSCAIICPSNAIIYGDRREIINTAFDRVNHLIENGNSKARVYGVDELDGMGMVYVLEDEPKYYGFPKQPAVSTSAKIWGAIFSPFRLLIALLVVFGILANKSEYNKVKRAKQHKEKRSSDQEDEEVK